LNLYLHIEITLPVNRGAGIILGHSYKIAVWPGDGVGPEVTAEAVKVLEATDVGFEFVEGTVGGRAYVEFGDPLPDEAREACEETDALLLGAVGEDYAPYDVPRKVMTYLRVEKDAYANVRPLKLWDGVETGALVPGSELDVVIVRDNSEGFALRHEGYFWEDKGYDKRVITRVGAERIARFAFEHAVKGGRGKVSCVDQSHWLFSDRLFRKGFESVSERYPAVEKDYVSVDVAAMLQVQRPGFFDVVVAPDIHGDILSGIVIGQTGGVGLAPSACLGDDFAFFEPVHGIALDIAGKGVANPIASILSAKLMLEWLGEVGEAGRVEAAVASVLVEGKVRTRDLGGGSSTVEVGDEVAGLVRGEALEGSLGVRPDGLVLSG
jgi:3-isopropylmalate dehydrogenase